MALNSNKTTKKITICLVIAAIAMTGMSLWLDKTFGFKKATLIWLIVIIPVLWLVELIIMRSKR